MIRIEKISSLHHPSICKYTLSNGNGLTIVLLNVGASIQNLIVPDRYGNLSDIVLGYENPDAYLTSQTYFGAVVGRYGNRIAKGRFCLEGENITLDLNDGNNHLHGGGNGYHQRFWQSRIIDDYSVEFSIHSPHGDQGFPGAVDIAVRYRIEVDRNQLTVTYFCTSDRPTVVNLTQHSYFNLTGDPTKKITDHLFQFNCDHFLPTDAELLPLGNRLSVFNTPFDFRIPRTLADALSNSFEQVSLAKGIDHTLIFSHNSEEDETLILVEEPLFGRTLAVQTDQPSVQFYTGNFLNGDILGKKNIAYSKQTGFCLETQHFPDSPNHPSFPSTVLEPHSPLNSSTTFTFGISEKL